MCANPCWFHGTSGFYCKDCDSVGIVVHKSGNPETQTLTEDDYDGHLGMVVPNGED